jgi:death on curing protein
VSRAYLSVEDVLGIHEDSIDAFGGSKGVRDMGMLTAAVMRPQSGYYPDLVAEAAALWESLSQNHPFIDGNKRTALASTVAFLAVNGYSLTCPSMGIYEFMMGLYESKSFRMSRLEEWLRANIVPYSRDF